MQVRKLNRHELVVLENARAIGSLPGHVMVGVEALRVPEHETRKRSLQPITSCSRRSMCSAPRRCDRMLIDPPAPLAYPR
jgi:hypothetical protein